jgi:hypothetical protein
MKLNQIFNILLDSQLCPLLQSCPTFNDFDFLIPPMGGMAGGPSTSWSRRLCGEALLPTSQRWRETKHNPQRVDNSLAVVKATGLGIGQPEILSLALQDGGFAAGWYPPM